MALQAAVQLNGYRYVQDIVLLDEEILEQSKAQFEHMKKSGIISAPSYNSNHWVITNEVKKGVLINFSIDEIHFVKEVSPKLGCSLSEYKLTMRVVITSCFGYSLRLLQGNAATMRRFANSFEVPDNYRESQLLLDFLSLLPGDTVFRNEIISRLEDISAKRGLKQKRELSAYQSFFRFDLYLDLFWNNAKTNEKTLYFPIYFWWKVTSILPLRPTECVLTPRNCIRQDSRGKYFLTIRRTSVKGKIKALRYSIADDYEMHEYQVPEALAVEIKGYIAATTDAYVSDIDTLFCKSSQFRTSEVLIPCDNHYTYVNLSQCLKHYYKCILQKQFNLTLVHHTTNLNEHEIGFVNLGDTRHIAMISLIISGGSPSVCKELAGHNGIEISSHYYSNISSFLDVLSYERYRPEFPTANYEAMQTLDEGIPVAEGYCKSPLVKRGDYSPCVSAVNSYGEFGVCHVCKFFLPKAGYTKLKTSVNLELQQTCILLRQTIQQLRKDNGSVEPLSCVLSKLRANAEQYCHISAVERLLKERNEL